MGVYEEWKKKVDEKIDKLNQGEKIPAVIKRCPKCFELSLEYDIKQGKIHCLKCGFEMRMKK